MPELDNEGLWTDDPGMMTTWTRRRVNPLTMTVDDVDIRDIAHSLARQCRYNGHVGGFLSVARHSIWVCDRLWSENHAIPDLGLAGLLHDAAEAYLGDLIRPLKHGPMGELYLQAEEHVERTIFERYGLQYPLPDVVAEADRAILMEVELGGEHEARWKHEGDQASDERHFLRRFEQLYDDSPTIVGISGYARAGKDTAAQVLIERYGFQRIAFADALRDMLYAINPRVVIDGEHVLDFRYTTVQALVDEKGWEWAKANVPEVRELLQRVGTEAGRDIIGDDVWVRTAMAKVKPGGRYVFTDVRFPNEADAIEEAGGELWRIHREGTEPVNAHPSETALDGREVAQYVHNTGTDLAGFGRLIDSIAFHKLQILPTA